VFLRGRIDLVHLLAFFGPIFTLLLMMQVDWRAGALRWIVSAWLLAAFGIMAIRWSTEWVQRPPSLHAVANVDSAFVTTPIPSIVDSLPGARAGRLPVLYLSHEASSLYFFWGPAIPPSTWLLPPSLPLNSPRDYAAFVRVAEQCEAPYIVLQPEVARRWESDPSPIRDLLRARYSKLREAEWGVVYTRSDAPAGVR
jgi:hypothetical protein